MERTSEILPLYNKKYFMVMAEEYGHLSYQYVFNLVLSVLDKYTEKRNKVLDVGCGVGWLLQHVLDMNCEAYGVDFAIAGIKMAKTKLKEANLLSSDGGHMPFKEEAFDLITCTWLLEHVEKPKEIVAEVFRLLKNGGIAIFMSPSGELTRTQEKKPTVTTLGEFGEEHFWEFSPIELEQLLQRSGFTVMERRGIYRFHFLNLFTYPVIKLVSSLTPFLSPEVENPVSIEGGTEEDVSERFTRIIDRFIPSPLIDILLYGSFNFFLKTEKFLGNKPVFNFFGIETLLVCQKPT